MVWPFLVSRVGVLAAGLAAVSAIGYGPPPNESATWRIAADPIVNLLARWDTYWYLDVATRGYRWNGNPLEQQNVAFFPLLPLMMRVGGDAIGGHPLVAGFLVSLTAFAAALVYLWKWTAERLGADVASGAVFLLCAFPFAVFFSAIYTESLFLLAAVAAWFHLERRELGVAAIFAFAAGLLRPNGFLLALPLAWLVFEYGHVAGGFLCGSANAGLKSCATTRKPFLGVAVVMAPVAAAALHSAYLAYHVGDGAAWIRAQAAWPTIAPWAPADPHSTTALDPWSVAIQVGNALALLLALLTLRPAVRLLGPASALFMVTVLLPPAARHGLQSLGRFASVLFPMFVVIAASLSNRGRWILAGCWAAGQIVAAMLFFTWRPLV